MSLILLFDGGFGSDKSAIAENGEVIHTSNNTNNVLELDTVTDTIPDTDVVEYNGKMYYITDSISLDTGKLIEKTNDEVMVKILPIVLKKYIQQYTKEYGKFDKIILCLTAAYNFNEDELKATIKNVTGVSQVIITKQGDGCYLAFKNKGTNIIGTTNKRLIESYLGLDIGYNTIDVLMVSNNTLQGGIKGVEDMGVRRIVSIMSDKIQSPESAEYKDLRNVSKDKLKSLLTEDNKFIRVRGKQHDLTKLTQESIDKWVDEIITYLNKSHASQLDNVTNIVLFGGGSYILRNNQKFNDEFGQMIVVPDNAEYYNVVGNLYKDTEA